jgi:hypothetical protein
MRSSDAGIKKLFWVGLDRTEDSLRGFFQILSDEVRKTQKATHLSWGTT